MEPIVVTITHSLGKDEVVRRLRPALGEASRMFPILRVEKEVWTGDRMDFAVRALGQTIIGNLEVREASVRLEARLPWLLARFAGLAQRTIARRGQLLLGKK